MSVSPTPSAPPSAPRTPSRVGAPLGSVNPNDIFTRGRTVDKSKHVDRENEWNATSHARRCLSCGSLGYCPCRGVSLPPEEKKRRIEAVLANTDFAKSRQRREFLRLSDLETRERMCIERREGDSFAFLVSLYDMHKREAFLRFDLSSFEAKDFNEILTKRDAIWAMVAAHAQQIELFVGCEEPNARRRITDLEAREYEHRLSTFYEMAQCLAECLAEQSAQRDDFCAQVMDMIMDFHEEEEVEFTHITTMEWQMSLEVVAEITEAKRVARWSLEAAAMDSALSLFALREAEVTRLFELFVEEHGSRLEWMREKTRAREALANEAYHSLTVTLPSEREGDLALLRAMFEEEYALREAWIDARRAERDSAEKSAIEALQCIVSEWAESRSALMEKETEEHAARLAWEEKKISARVEFSRSAVDVLLGIQSQRADEIHEMYELYLSEHSDRLEWIEAKLRARQAFSAECEREMWQIYTTARDATLAMAASAEEGVADVLIVIRAKAEERRRLVVDFESSLSSQVTAQEASAREELKARFEEEGELRIKWAAERLAERAAVENEARGFAATLFTHDFMPSFMEITRVAEAELCALIERREKLISLVQHLEREETDARARVIDEEAYVVKGDIYSSYCLSWETAKTLEIKRLLLDVESEEARGRSQLVSDVEMEYSRADHCHRQMLSALSEAALQRLAEQREYLLDVELSERSRVAEEAFESIRELYAHVRRSLQVAWGNERAAEAARLQADQQRHMQLCMLRQSLSVYSSAYGSSDGSDVLAGFPEAVADALRSASSAQIEQMSAMIFGFGDHVAAFSNNIDASLRRGAQLLSEEERAARTVGTLTEQRDFYANKNFTDNATQQAKLASIRQNVANRRQEAKRIEGTLKETAMAVQNHKNKVEAMKDAYRGGGGGGAGKSGVKKY